MLGTFCFNSALYLEDRRANYKTNRVTQHIEEVPMYSKCHIKHYNGSAISYINLYV